ncbi:MAG: Asp-tRNA(Asn)/Glu-tRNA(Gln) amidotransferase subunit GatB [Betaproteobacteria bacterium]|nr:Asp-tRNA(Asn)/Glu-tRNA(Gln) amidotransferase subunit GatB [Betaproteobacteria bacterium]
MAVQDWQMVIGIETHVQLATRAKMFSSAPAAWCEQPNLQANELDFGMPGTLPVANQAAVDMAVRFGLAVDARIATVSEFARKHYFYPDLPKGYQISQFEHPIINGGLITVADDDDQFAVRLVRAHLEEDAGKLTHDMRPGKSLADYNRAGLPLLEIVSEPDLRSARQAAAYGRTLHKLVRWLQICDGNMQEGSLRFDVNVSLRHNESDPLGTRCEIKNLNSFRFVEQAIENEAARQAQLLEAGESIIQQTRLFDTTSGQTRAMRSKEDAQDYRYFPDPDLLPLRIDEQTIEKIRRGMPELPDACRQRYIDQYGLSPYDAGVLSAERGLATYFDEVARQCPDAKLAANWVAGDLLALCNSAGTTPAKAPVTAAMLAGLLSRIADQTVSGKMGKEILAKMWQSQKPADEIIEGEGLSQISDAGQLQEVLATIIEKNPKQVQQYQAGKHKLLGFFVGQAMKETGGQANPQQLNELAKRMLDEQK